MKLQALESIKRRVVGTLTAHEVNQAITSFLQYVIWALTTISPINGLLLPSVSISLTGTDPFLDPMLPLLRKTFWCMVWLVIRYVRMYSLYHRENRYLLFLTENYAALQILYHYLHGAVNLTTAPGHEDKRMEPFVLFGSSFPRDKEYTQVQLLLLYRYVKWLSSYFIHLCCTTIYVTLDCSLSSWALSRASTNFLYCAGEFLIHDIL